VGGVWTAHWLYWRVRSARPRVDVEQHRLRHTMDRTSRALRLLPAILAVWCLGCDAFEAIAESLLESRPPASIAGSVADTSTAHDGLRAAVSSPVDAGAEAADACDCVLGHAAVVSVTSTVDRPASAPGDFVERPPTVVMPAREPLLRPPVA
jgi:hypothetical protein